MEQKKTPNIEIPYREEISRLFIFRGLWVLIMMWPLIPWAIWIQMACFLQFWHMLVLGRRHKGLWESKVRFFRHVMKWQSYLMFMTDLRPKFIED